MDTLTLISNSKKFKTTQDLYKNLDIIAELLKEDISNICEAKQIFFADFEASFKVALSQTKETLLKKNLKGVKKFFGCTNLKESLKWFRNRLINNMKNANDTKRKFAFQPPIFSDFKDYNIITNYNLDDEIEIENLLKIDKVIIKQALRKVWESSKYDPDFNLQDLKDLCSKYKINLLDILNKEELETPRIGFYIKENGLKQGYFIFDEVAA